MSSIYVLHRDPKINASMHCDQDVLGSILYYAQLLATAYAIHDDGALVFAVGGWELNRRSVYTPLDSDDKMAQWVAATQENYRWTRRMLLALLAEYQRRWGDAKGKRHKTWDVAETLREVPRLLRARSVYSPQAMTPFVTRTATSSLPKGMRHADVTEVHRYLYARTWREVGFYRMGEMPEFMARADFDPVPDDSPLLTGDWEPRRVEVALDCPVKLYDGCGASRFFYDPFADNDIPF